MSLGRVGRYDLVREIASGGMGTVFLARAGGPGGFDKTVALKVIHRSLARDRGAIEMFLDEARIAARISHPNVCPVFEFGEVDGKYFLAMEYVHGEPLSRVVAALSQQRDIGSTRLCAYAARIVADSAEGLHAAHELRDETGRALEVVHRDVSPQNIFLTHDGTVRVVDFGIARALGRVHQTISGVVKGKIAYMPPEQLQGHDVDRRADIWALGVTLWELLTCQRLFGRETTAATIQRVLYGDIAKPSEVRSSVPAPLDAIVMTALCRDRSSRYPTARAFAQDLTRFVTWTAQPAAMAEIAEWMAELFAGPTESKSNVGARVSADPTAETRVEGRPTEAQQPAPARIPVPAQASQSTIQLPLVKPESTAVVAFGGVAVGVAIVVAWVVLQPTSEPPQQPQQPTSLGSDAGAAGSQPVPLMDATVREVTAVDDGSSRSAPDASQKPVLRRPARELGTGTVDVATPGGWADVYFRGARVGRTPLRVELPAGRQTIELRPHGRPVGARIRITVVAQSGTRVVRPIDSISR